MKKIITLGLLIFSARISHESMLVRKSDAEIYKHKTVVPDGRNFLNYEQTVQPKLELIIDVKNTQMPSNDRRKHRRERIRNKKEKSGKVARLKSKTSQKSVDYIEKHILRNNEKVNLVRNRTIEILKNGIKILSPGEDRIHNNNKSTPRANETLMEKILSSTAGKPDVLLSLRGTYKVPIGIEMYETKTASSEGNDFPDMTVLRSEEEPERTFDVTKKENKKANKNADDSYDYDYDSLFHFGTNLNLTTGYNKSYKAYAADNGFERVSGDHNVGIILTDMINMLKNLSDCPDGGCSKITDKIVRFEDPCQKWLNCKESLESVFFGSDDGLPSCPCIYPSLIFYNDSIWDEKRMKFFRWRDASGDSERLDIYKPGASYCIRSLLTPGASSISSQQCCYDRKLKLITRGSGAGTMNFISPDVSKRLHDTVDMLPWRLCKGDFTRYNLARSPDNGNGCPVNPDEKQYQLQVKLSKIF